MSTMKIYGRKKQHRRAAKTVSIAKKQMGIYRSGTKYFLKGSTDSRFPVFASRRIAVRGLIPRSHSYAYKILASQENRELDNAISTLKRAML